MNPSKKEYRAFIRARKRELTPEDISLRSTFLCRQVLGTDTYRNAKTIYGYLPFNQEVDLTTLLQQALADGKQVALPKCYGKDMRFILISDLSQVQPSPFGAPEPVDDSPIAADKSALVLVPGLVFDRRGFRIDYGGGYYDRFFSLEPSHPTIALCYDFQVVDHLNPDLYDIPVDCVFAD